MLSRAKGFYRAQRLREFERSYLKILDGKDHVSYLSYLDKRKTAKAAGGSLDMHKFNTSFDKHFYRGFDEKNDLPPCKDKDGVVSDVYKRNLSALSKLKIRFSAESKIYLTSYVEHVLSEFLNDAIVNCFTLNNKIVKLHHAFNDKTSLLMSSLSSYKKWLVVEAAQKTDDETPQDHEDEAKYPFSLYVSKMFKHCKHTMDDSDKYVSASLNQNLKKFCSDAIIELLKRVNLMIKEEMDTRSVKTVTNEIVVKVASHMYSTLGKSFDKVRTFLNTNVPFYKKFVEARRETVKQSNLAKGKKTSFEKKSSRESDGDDDFVVRT
jgi:hypothetical protein